MGAVLIVETDHRILHEKLLDLVNSIENLDQDVLMNWNGNIEVFKPVPSIVEKIFNVQEK